MATLEKANSLIDSLLETDRISELGVVVIDEIHMLSETGGRGAKLESVVTKLKHFARKVTRACIGDIISPIRGQSAGSEVSDGWLRAVASLGPNASGNGSGERASPVKSFLFKSVKICRGKHMMRKQTGDPPPLPNPLC